MGICKRNATAWCLLSVKNLSEDQKRSTNNYNEQSNGKYEGENRFQNLEKDQDTHYKNDDPEKDE